LSRVFSLLGVLMFVFCAVVLVSIIRSIGKGNVPNVFGYSFLNVTTGSMLPTYKPGDIVVAKKTRIADLRERDIISFYAIEPAIEGLPNTHRIIKIDIVDGRYYIITKGDANLVNDPYPVFEENLIGKAVANLPGAGKAVSVLQNRAVIFFLLILPLMVIMVMEIKHIASLTGKKDPPQSAGKEGNETVPPEDERPQQENDKRK